MDTKKKNPDIIDLMIEKRMCVSKAEARRVLDSLGEESVKKKIERIKIIKCK